MTDTQSIKSIIETASNPQTEYSRWKSEIQYGLKELSGWHKNGLKSLRRYSDDRGALDSGSKRYNLFAANVDVLTGALYSTPPRVSVTRKFDDYDDDTARVAAIILQRCLEQDLYDPNNPINRVFAQAVQDRLVPGMGTAWLRVEVEEEEQTDPITQQIIPVVVSQRALAEHVHWQDLLWSPCRIWDDRRWVARRVYMTYDKGVKRFGDKFKNVPMVTKSKAGNESDESGPENKLIQEAEIWEIWDREQKEIIWISTGYPEILDKKKDFLELSGFEPTPQPFFALQTTSVCIPIPDYIRWIDQYTELDTINQRIAMLVKACRAAGVYDKAQDGVKNLMSDGTDNKLIPVDNWAMFAEKGGLKGLIDWLPLETIVAAQATLREAREDIKVQIYELTGISDVVRGSSNPHETLGAQRMKADFASSRIQVLQTQFEAWATEVLRIKAEIMCRHFPDEALLAMSNIMNTADADIAPMAVKALKSEQFVDFRIAIEPFSMAQVDFSQEKADRIEFLSTMGTFLEKAIAAAQTVPEMVPMMTTMIKFLVSGFKVSATIEGAIDRSLDAMVQGQQARQAQPPKPSPEELRLQYDQQKLALDNKKIEADSAKAQGEAMLEGEKMKQQAAADAQKLEQDQQKFLLELEMMRESHQMEMQRLAVELKIAERKADVELQTTTIDAISNVRTAEENSRGNLIDHAGKMLDVEKKTKELETMDDDENEPEDDDENED
jgi:hypothetical protein